MAGLNRRPEVEPFIMDWFLDTPKAVLMELLRDYALQLNGNENIEEAFNEIKARREILKVQGGTI